MIAKTKANKSSRGTTKYVLEKEFGKIWGEYTAKTLMN